jgi:calcineurin-like phosphoesterase family protein
MFGFSRSGTSSPSGPRGRRAYVVGDIHGRLDLLDQLLEQIHDEIGPEPDGEVLLVFLGDLIDRGPNSFEVVERLRTYRHRGVRRVFILGNHEEVLLRILAGQTELITSWLRFGGAQCLKSYGTDPNPISVMDHESALGAIKRAIPDEHVAFLNSFVDTCRFGDYLFVHAGIRPGIELDRQRQNDLRWIREPFLRDLSDHGFVVVHGHTISRGIDEQPNRIGIDTGAYHSGILTALVIEGAERRYLDTSQEVEPAITPAH